MRLLFMRLGFSIAMSTLIALSLSAPLLAQVQHCAERMQNIDDGRLEAAINALKQKNRDLVFQPDERPCLHAKSTISAVAATLERNYLHHVTGYELVKIINGESYFTVERFKSSRPSDLIKIAAALKRHTPHKLAIEANTVYEVFLDRDSLILMISSAVGSELNVDLFRQIEQSLGPAATSELRVTKRLEIISQSAQTSELPWWI